jgi:hypothetical protein
MDDELAAVLSESYRLIQQGREADLAHVEWQHARAARERLNPPPPPAPPPASKPWMTPDERERVMRSIARNRERPPMRNPSSVRFDAMAKAVGEVLAHERGKMRAHVAGVIRETTDQCTKRETRIRALEDQRLADARSEIMTLCALRDEIGALRSALAELRRERAAAKVIDLPIRGAS